ncbi:MAG: hypothetical protein II984_08140 [Clostridia bacterium]|nr:hypothetical protein [Clostridia bacterium]
MKEKLKDVATRAFKTFWQAMIAYLIATFGTQLAGVDVFDASALKNVFISLLIGALSAGISAAWNGVIQPLLDRTK